MMTQREIGMETLAEEYRTLLAEIEVPEGTNCNTQWDNIAVKLHRDASWTPSGADQIVRLARDYGVFMLRNALALAFVMNIEDGELAF